jgi:hypothetical protein
MTTNDHLAAALHRVIGSHLFRSGLGHVWCDDRTWREFARELVSALAGSVVLVGKAEYARLVADAEQMKLVRAYIEEYKAGLPKDQKQRSGRSKNAYAQWAAENMTSKEESKP